MGGSKPTRPERTSQVTRSRPPAARLPGALIAVAIAVLLQSVALAAESSESDCVMRAEAVKTAVVRAFGGDDVNYGFFRRADQASALCRGGRIGEALGLIAALKADLRGYRNELFEDR